MENHNIESSNLSEETSFDHYVKMKNKLNNKTENIDYIIQNMPPVYSGTDTYIKEYIKDLSKEELHARAKGLINAQNLTQNEYLLEHMSQKSIGNFNHFRAQWSPILWQSHEKIDNQKIKIGDKIVNACDLNYSIASSLEIQDSHRDPITEYYDWIKIQTKFENDINTDGTTVEEIENRNNFIDFMDMRETEIKNIAMLYSAAALNPNSPMQELAQEKLKFVLFKLSELRRLRDKMKATKSTHDKEKSKEPEENENNTSKNDNLFGLSLLLSLTEDKLNKILKDHNVTDLYTNSNQHSMSGDRTTQKISNLKNNSENIRTILAAMRNGISKEDWLKQQKENTDFKTKNDYPIEPISGFTIDHYNQALKELNA